MFLPIQGTCLVHISSHFYRRALWWFTVELKPSWRNSTAESSSTIFATDEWSRLRMSNLFDEYTKFAWNKIDVYFLIKNIAVQFA